MRETGRTVALFAVLAVAPSLPGCGAPEDTAVQGPGHPQAAVDEEAPAQRFGRIRGVVRIEGPPPEARILPVAGVAEAAEMYADRPLLNPDYEVNEDGTVPNALVIVSIRTLREAGYEAPPPSQNPVRFAQRGYRYVPNVMAVQAGQPLEYTVVDGFGCTLHIRPGRNDEVNRHVPAGATVRVVFEKPEKKIVPVGCDVMSWMGGWIGVFDHPLFTTVSSDGSWQIDGVPPGEHELIVWTKQLGRAELKVVVEAGRTADLDVVLRKR